MEEVKVKKKKSFPPLKPDEKDLLKAKRYRKLGGCLPYFINEENDNKEILMIVSNKSTKKSTKWVIPAGEIERGENNKEAGQRECLEEAGVTGKLGQSIGN
jgi:diphosphoinositol-polyphosphate diphosphatase